MFDFAKYVPNTTRKCRSTITNILFWHCVQKQIRTYVEYISLLQMVNKQIRFQNMNTKINR